MRLLVIDTALGACTAAVFEDDRALAVRFEPMTKGHQERIGGLVRDVMAEAGGGFESLDRIGVTVGPGSFTGLRVGLAFAKGLSAALAIPAVGVGSLEALAQPHKGRVFAVLDAKRGQVYLQAFDDGAAVSAPDALPIETAAARVAELAPDILVGTGAALLAQMRPSAQAIAVDHADPAAIAALGASRSPVPPHPLYLRAPDAKLPGGKSLSE